MMNGVSSIFRHFKNFFLMCDTVPSKTSRSTANPHAACINFASDNEMPGQASVGCNFEDKANITFSTGCNGESALVDPLDRDNGNAGSNSKSNLVEYSSMNMSITTINDLMEDVKHKLIAEMKTMIEESRNETENMIVTNVKQMSGKIEDNRKEIENMKEENKKETKRLIEDNRQEILQEMKNKTEDNQKEIKMMNEKGNATYMKRREQKDIMANKK